MKDHLQQINIYLEDFKIINGFIQDAQINNDPVKLNVGGVVMVVGRQTLTSVPGSRLAEMFLVDMNLRQVDQGEIFIDRDHLAFSYLITYLRNGRKYLPNITNEMKVLIEIEIAYWKLQEDREIE